MTTRTSRGILQLCMCLALLSASAASPALELGKPVARSGIGERLMIDVPILGAPEQLRALKIQAASRDTSINEHLRPLSIPAGTTYSLNGRVIEIRSPTVVTEPYVNLALELFTPHARTLHYITVLLNPPDYRATGVAQKLPDASSSDRGSAAAQRYGPVRKGEKLSLIAKALQPQTGGSLEQVLWALFKSNPKAFNGGVDRLKAGVYLTIPPAHIIMAVEPQTAAAELEAMRAAPPVSVSAQVANEPSAVPRLALNAVEAPAMSTPTSDSDTRSATENQPAPGTDSEPLSAPTTDALDKLAHRVSVLDQHAGTLRAQLA
ncbi:MAG: hypothetical protein OES09_05190, partial [Gammaproteobacteria bacterium]|nr:hypothetical protein [Gammaproteobacteria bacterium]